ncbi:MAG: 1,4-dihydroxy-2-naphthoate octaprenyltransferase [Candidatus Binataceae bacterium]
MDQAGTISPAPVAHPGTLKVWLQASRAFTLGMPFTSVTVGTFLALYRDAPFSLIRYLVAAVAAMLLQAGANLINDYYDFIKGTDLDNWESPDAFGPGLVIQQGLLTAEQIRVGGLVSFAVGSILGLGLAWVCGWPILILGLVGALGAYFYTAAPLSLAYRGLGDFMVFALMGPGYVLGAYFVQMGAFSSGALWTGCSMGLLCSSLLQANNLRDIENDRKHSKWTVAALVGRRAAIVELITCDALAFLIVIASVLTHRIPWLCLAVMITLPRAIDQIRLVAGGADATAYNRAMARSGQLQFEFGLVLVAAFILSRLFGW